MKLRTFAASAVLAVLVTTGCASGGGGGVTTDKKGVAHVDVAVLEAPSLTSFYAPIIDGKKLDIANGIDINFVPSSTVALRTEIASGATKVTAGASVLTDAALLNQRGADVVFLFNVFDWWGTVVTPVDTDIHEVADLEGKKVVGALSTTNYAMFKMTAGLNGVDLASLKETSAEPSGLVASAKSGREEAVELWEPAHSVLTLGNEDFRSLDLIGEFRKATGLERVPYVGVAVQRAWLNENESLVNPLYRTFADAVDFIKENPDEAADLIAAGTKIDVEVLRSLLSAPDRLALDVYPAKDAASELDTLLDIATKYGVLDTKPELESLVYMGDMKR